MIGRRVIVGVYFLALWGLQSPEIPQLFVFLHEVMGGRPGKVHFRAPGLL